MPAVLARFVTTVVVLTLAAVAAHATEDRYPATAQQDFDATNPEFDRNRKDDNLGLGMVIVDRRFFDSKQWVGQAMLAWHRQDSNIDFYDAESAIASIGAQYGF